MLPFSFFKNFKINNYLHHNKVIFFRLSSRIFPFLISLKCKDSKSYFSININFLYNIKEAINLLKQQIYTKTKYVFLEKVLNNIKLLLINKDNDPVAN